MTEADKEEAEKKRLAEDQEVSKAIKAEQAVNTQNTNDPGANPSQSQALEGAGSDPEGTEALSMTASGPQPESTEDLSVEGQNKAELLKKQAQKNQSPEAESTPKPQKGPKLATGQGEEPDPKAKPEQDKKKEGYEIRQLDTSSVESAIKSAFDKIFGEKKGNKLPTIDYFIERLNKAKDTFVDRPLNFIAKLFSGDKQPVKGPNQNTSKPAPAAAGPEADGPEAAGPEAAGPEAAGPEAAGPEAAGPEAAAPEAASPEAAGPEAAAPEAVEPAAPAAAGPEADSNGNERLSLIQSFEQQQQSSTNTSISTSISSSTTIVSGVSYAQTDSQEEKARKNEDQNRAADLGQGVQAPKPIEPVQDMQNGPDNSSPSRMTRN